MTDKGFRFDFRQYALRKGIIQKYHRHPIFNLERSITTKNLNAFKKILCELVLFPGAWKSLSILRFGGCRIHLFLLLLFKERSYSKLYS